MPMNFFDHCLVQAMNDPTPNKDFDQERLHEWALGAYKKAQALDRIRLEMTEKMAEAAQEHLNHDLEHRSAIS